MSTRRLILCLGALITTLIGTTACGMQVLDNAISTVEAISTPGRVVDVTPMSPTDLALQPQGTSEPGAGTGGGETPPEPTVQGEPTRSGDLAVYSNSLYKFSVGYPSDFVFRVQPAEKLKQLMPVPTAAFSFINPAIAASNVPDEPADLEIRVYNASQQVSLDQWLTMNGLLPADGSVTPKPFKTKHLAGLEVCASTMLAPGCSYFFLSDHWVYQLTPASLPGEEMIGTFRLLP